ncbi:MAG TPA: hypothetical protein VMH35_09500 [Streptosporangiaceae bacterium]|nr:hypothetical protein [Streptosporangiaceae bacterium]
MIRRAALAGLALTGALGPLAVAGPAAAGPGAGPGVGCTGSTCSVQLSDLITLRGDYGATGSAQLPVAVPPPPCLWQAIGGTATGSRSIIGSFGAAAPSTPFGVSASVRQARAFLRDHPVPAGFWWELPVNPAAPPAAQRSCQRFPLFAWAVPGVTPAEPPVPLRTLAGYAYNHMRIPAPVLTTSPAGTGYVNLASYVWGPTRPVSAMTGRPGAYEVTATLGHETVTVWAQLAARGAFSVAVRSGHGVPYSAGCGPDGSRYPVGRAPASAGAGTPPDCGVLWQAPDPAAIVSAAVRWSVSWGPGPLAGPGRNRLPAILTTGQSRPFPVAEIQSINGG